MSVWPVASQTFTPLGTGIIDAPADRAQCPAEDAPGYLDDLIDNEEDPSSDAAAARAAKTIVLVADPLGIDPADFDPSNDSEEPVDLVTRVTSHQEEDGTYDLGPLFNGVLYTALALRTQGLSSPDGLLDQILAAQRPEGTGGPR